MGKAWRPVKSTRLSIAVRRRSASALYDVLVEDDVLWWRRMGMETIGA